MPFAPYPETSKDLVYQMMILMATFSSCLQRFYLNSIQGQDIDPDIGFGIEKSERNNANH
jgi:hypothetical protein